MSKHAPNTYSLVADIGGTNTRVALARGTEIAHDTVRKYPNADFPGLEDVLRAYIAAEDDVDCIAACVAVAGPVRDGVGELTNLDWTIDNATLASATRAERVAIVNDLQAQGFALGFIADDHITPVVRGTTAPEHGASQLVIGVGTGFNAAPVHYAKSARSVLPSECGHSSLPLHSETDLRLGLHVEKLHGFASVEDVLSGRGLAHIYDWLSLEAGETTKKSAAEIMAAVADGSDPRAEDAARTFVRLMGIVAGDLSLIHLPFGGVYLIGGVVRAMTPYLDRFGFADAFRAKGRFGYFMDEFSVSVIEDDFAALTGCASYLDTSA